MSRPFQQVDVFAATPLRGNPVAVVLGADGLSTEDMARLARWTNLSETTFVLAPTDAPADYRVRIFTPAAELPFAGHPTIGTCHAWLRAGGVPAADIVVQECAAGLIRVRRDGGRLAFAAPPLLRSGPVDEATLAAVVAGLGVARADVVDAAWADNGPGWIAVRLATPTAVLALSPTTLAHDVGVVAVDETGGGLEVRAFFPLAGVTREDPVTGSLNASVAQWLLGAGVLTAPYVARQGTALGRQGRVHISQDDDGQVWVGGDAVTVIDGDITM
ncbi:MAG: PhzF family phenazine biosynthesis protein [Actinomycetota bacterium]|nr:PhzF family phenazine biosynthesis protein [Actinomycetota bacterium]